MRKTFLMAISAICLFIFLTGCTKEAATSVTDLAEIKKSITKQPIEQQYVYVRDNFKKIMNELAPLFKDPGFMDYLRSEAAKKFDGDYNVLIKTIIMNPMYTQKINATKIQFFLDAFKGLDGEDYYPQIYFPFFEKHQAAKNNVASGSNLVDNQEVVLYDGNESAPSFPVYQYDDITDSLAATGIYADEPYALANELLIISLNETGDPGVTGGTGQTQANINFRIQNLNVKDGKESWVAGASEVHIRAWGQTWNHRQYGYPNSAFVDYNVLRSTSNKKGH